MRANRGTHTGPEMSVRRALHARGWRYRTHKRLSAAGIQVRPDLVFSSQRVAIFIDGCYWHGCPTHGSSPKGNSEYWQAKFLRNTARDTRVNEALRSEGWTVVRVWEHVAIAEATQQIERVLRKQSQMR